MKRLVALCGTLVLTLAMAAPAAAVQPYVWYDEDFDDYYLAVGDCGDFMVDVRSVGHASEKLYFGDKGYETVVRTLFKARGTDHLINDDSGKQITAQFRVTCHVDIVQEEPLVYVRKCTGGFWNLSVPGAGLIAHDAGAAHRQATQPRRRAASYSSGWSWSARNAAWRLLVASCSSTSK